MKSAQSAQHPDRNELHVLTLDAYNMALSAHAQVSALASLAGMAPRGQNLSGEEWMFLLNPLAEHIGLLVKMLEHDAATVEWRMTRP